MEKIKCPPDPSRTIVGFRDTGYNLYTAVADIVDNSINARARNVIITIDKDPVGQVHIRIADDGYGMSRDELVSAMRYGAPEHKKGNALGRFGLGLKTASTSVCRQLTVLSRKTANHEVVAARWDLDAVKTDWLLEVGAPDENLAEEFRELVPGSGTLVCWDKVDRIGANNQFDKQGLSDKSLSAYRVKLRDHLQLVFHRFLGNRISITLNGERLEPWDPFVLTEKTECPLKRTYSVKLPEATQLYEVQLNAYVIPNKYEYSTNDARDRAKIKSNLQGFYVYREDRVIIAHSWLDLFATEPHFSLLRVELSFPRELDELFGLDIKKSTLNLAANSHLEDTIKQEIKPVRAHAEARYRAGKRTGQKKHGTSPHAQSQGLLDSKYKEETANLQTRQVGENKVEITNANGTTIITMPTIKTANVKELIEVVDSLPNGLFWEPALVNNRLGLRISRGHMYYERVYVPSFSDGVTVQGIDSLLWALAKCEQDVLDAEIRKSLINLRFFVSKTLHDLAEELPEPEDVD